jgi:hypothetical protein
VYELFGRDLFSENRGCFEFYLYELFGRDLFSENRGCFEIYLYELFGRDLFHYRWSNGVYELFGWYLFK